MKRDRLKSCDSVPSSVETLAPDVWPGRVCVRAEVSYILEQAFILPQGHIQRLTTICTHSHSHPTPTSHAKRAQRWRRSCKLHTRGPQVGFEPTTSVIKLHHFVPLFQFPFQTSAGPRLTRTHTDNTELRTEKRRSNLKVKLSGCFATFAEATACLLQISLGHRSHAGLSAYMVKSFQICLLSSVFTIKDALF